MSDLDETQPDTKQWVLDPETEYRFELDPGSSLTIKVCLLKSAGELSFQPCVHSSADSWTS